MYLEELVNDLNVDGYKFATEIMLNHEDIIDWLKLLPDSPIVAVVTFL